MLDAVVPASRPVTDRPHRRPAGWRAGSVRRRRLLRAAPLLLCLGGCGEPDPAPDRDDERVAPAAEDGTGAAPDAADTTPAIDALGIAPAMPDPPAASPSTATSESDGAPPVATTDPSGPAGTGAPGPADPLEEPNGPLDAPLDPSPDPSLGEPLDPPLDEPSSETAVTIGVDCASSLPCRLAPADGGVAATLTAADGEAFDGSGPLRLDLVLETSTRDATVAIESTSSVVTGGQALAVDALRLGGTSAPGARDEASHALVAGVPVNGYVTFADAPIGNPRALDRVVLDLTEAGSSRTLVFTDVPLGPERTAAVDCAGALPCRWTSVDGDATLVLTDAMPARWNRATRLVVSWSLSVARPLEIALVGPGRVTNGAGETLEPYGVELDGIESRDGTVLVRALDAGERVVGRVVPRRAPEEGESRLARVEIAVLERRSPRAPRWRPLFTDVPIDPTPSTR